MADGIELAKAYVQIVPTTKNIRKELNSAMGGDAEKAGSDTGKAFGEKFKGAVSAAAKVAAAGIAAAAGGVAAITKSAVSAYADYEQLAGGAELMWGDAYDFIAAKAASAFSSVQMSTNDYLESANYYATGLKTALGGDVKAAAELADSIITAQADIVSATGNSAEAVSNAFNGVMRGNFTMLDNLGLGIAGTKEGMQQVIDSVNEWRVSQGQTGDLVVDSVADCQQALVDYVAMQNMAGYASAEGSETIQGSLASLQASWSNLLVGMSNGSAETQLAVGENLTQFDILVAQLTTSAGAVLDNILPRVTMALDAVGQLISGIAPVIIGYLPTFVAEVLPGLVETALTLFTTLNTTLIENLPLFTETAIQIIVTLITGISESMPDLLAQAPLIIDSLTTALTNNLPLLLSAALGAIVTIVQGLIDNLPTLVASAANLIGSLAQGLLNYLPQLLKQAPVIITQLCTSIAQNLPLILQTAGQLIIGLVRGIIQALPQILKSGWDIVKALVSGIGSVFSSLWQVGKDLVQQIWHGLTGKISDAASWGKDLISNFIGGLKQKWENLKNTVKDIAGGIKSFLGFSEPEEGPLSDFHTYAPDMMKLFAKGIKDNEYRITDQIDSSFDLSPTISGNFGMLASPMAGGQQNTISINVYASDGMDVRELAQKVSEEIAAATRRKEAAWA